MAAPTSSSDWILRHHDDWTRATIHIFFSEIEAGALTADQYRQFLIDRLTLATTLKDLASHITSTHAAFFRPSLLALLDEEHTWIARFYAEAEAEAGGGGGGGGGGGYFTQTQGNAGGGGGGGSMTDRVRTVLPLMIKALHTATQSPGDDCFRLPPTGAALSTVTLLAKITHIANFPTHLTLTLFDKSAEAEARLWFDSDEHPAAAARRAAACEVGRWVRVFGQLREVPGEGTIVNLHHVRAVEDPNELVFHRLECVQAYVQLLRPNAPHRLRNAAGAAARNNAPGAYGAAPAYGAPQPAYGAPPQASSGYGAAAPAPSGAGGSRDEQLVIDALRAADTGSHDGVDINVVAQQVQQFNMSRGRVLEVIKALYANGMVYETIDETHYKLSS